MWPVIDPSHVADETGPLSADPPVRATCPRCSVPDAPGLAGDGRGPGFPRDP